MPYIGYMRAKGVAPAIRKLHEKYPEMPKSVIAKRVGCSTENVRSVLATYLGDVSEDSLREYQANRGDVFDALGHRALLHITEAKLTNAKPMELTTMAAILYDKARLERGQATGINVSVLLDVAQAIRERRSGVIREEKANVIDG
jgi:hypothetical protein